MKVFYGLFAVTILCLCSYAQTERTIAWPDAATEHAFVAGEDGRMVGSDLKALEIVKINVEAKPIVPGKQFSAVADWLRTLTVKVRNISDKKISSIRLSFILLDIKSFSLEYGKELSTGIDYGVQPPIEPGKEVVLARNDRHYTRDVNGIASRTGVMDFDSVIIGISTVKFEDGTVWSSYKLPIASVSGKSN